MFEKIQEAADYLKSSIADFAPQVGIILGTGLGKLTEEIEIAYEFPYEEIPHFPTATVEFHKSRLLFGKLGGKQVVCMQGRFHFYEGYTLQEVTFPVRVMKLLGVETLLVSNAAGGMNPAFREGDLMLIEDHISLFLPGSPLAGPNLMGDRFPDMSEPYDAQLLSKAKELATELKISHVQSGVYVSVPGPQLETKAEYRMLRQLGADAVGMSTVPEVIVARQQEMRVFGVSVITDLAIPETLQKAEISKILANAAKAEPAMAQLIKALVASL